MGPQLSFKRGVSREVRKALREFFRNVQEVVRFEHELPVIVLPTSVIGIDRKACDGGFCIWGGQPRLVIGGEVDHEHDYTLAAILDTAAHELAHYEQFRDGRKLDERGVKVRA